MNYKKWFLAHGEKHRKIIKKLKNKSDDEIIEYFKFENMVKNEPDFCPLYKDNKKCHNIENLQCYLCACPHFRFSDSGIENENEKILYSFCSINSKKGSKFENKNCIHQDCSNCLIPHKKQYIKKHFDKNWFDIMKDVRIATQ